MVQEATTLHQLVADNKVVAGYEDFGGWMLPQHQILKNRNQSLRNQREVLKDIIGVTRSDSSFEILHEHE